MSDRQARVERRLKKRREEPEKWARAKAARKALVARVGDLRPMQVPDHIRQLADKIKNEK